MTAVPGDRHGVACRTDARAAHPRVGRPARRRTQARRLRGAVAAGLLVVTAAACGGGGGEGRDADASRDAWAAKALDTLRDLARDLQDTRLGCEDFEPYDFDAIASDYAGRLPLPAAMGRCTGPDDEELELAAFDRERDRDDFVEAKTALLCRRAREIGIEGQFPGFDYAAGPTWVVQPDTAGVARRVAQATNGAAQRARCD